MASKPTSGGAERVGGRVPRRARGDVHAGGMAGGVPECAELLVAELTRSFDATQANGMTWADVRWLGNWGVWVRFWWAGPGWTSLQPISFIFTRLCCALSAKQSAEHANDGLLNGVFTRRCTGGRGSAEMGRRRSLVATACVLHAAAAGVATGPA
eukprot:160041-Chlamydomonas_euryale.AAC.7